MEKLINFETEFWSEIVEIVKVVERDDLEKWLVKLWVHIENEEKKILKRKRKKIRKLISNHVDLKSALDRMEEHEKCFTFKNELLSYCSTIFEDFENLTSLAKLTVEILTLMRKLFYLMILM